MKTINLTRLIENNEIKIRFDEWFSKPHFTIKKSIAHSPITKNPQIVGTAFDYLLRFKLQYLNPHSISRVWIAENAINYLNTLLNSSIKIPESERMVFKTWVKEGNLVLSQAKKCHEQHLKDGIISNELLESCLHLGKLNSIFRAGYIKG